MSTKLLSLYGLKYNPFGADIPVEALYIPPAVDLFLQAGCRLAMLAREELESEPIVEEALPIVVAVVGEHLLRQPRNRLRHRGRVGEVSARQRKLVSRGSACTEEEKQKGIPALGHAPSSAMPLRWFSSCRAICRAESWNRPGMASSTY